MSIPGDANLAEYKSGSSCGAPLWQRALRGGMLPRQFSENATRREKTRRDPAKSILETLLGRRWCLKNLVENVGSGNLAECQRGRAPFTTTRPPFAPRRFLHGGPRARDRESHRVPGSGAARFPPRPKGGASVVVYIANGTVWTQENFVEIFEKTQQVGYRCLAGAPSFARQRSNS